jgi:predicted nucleic acid-binding Zn ribbon protein
MQCPLCNAQIDDNAVTCEKCGATRVTRRTPAGIVVGWIGMTIALLMVMMGAFIVALPLFGVTLSGYPWTAFLVGTLIAVGLLQYSRSTVRREWLPRKER